MQNERSVAELEAQSVRAKVQEPLGRSVLGPYGGSLYMIYLCVTIAKETERKLK